MYNMWKLFIIILIHIYNVRLGHCVDSKFIFKKVCQTFCSLIPSEHCSYDKGKDNFRTFASHCDRVYANCADLTEYEPYHPGACQQGAAEILDHESVECNKTCSIFPYEFCGWSNEIGFKDFDNHCERAISNCGLDEDHAFFPVYDSRCGSEKIDLRSKEILSLRKVFET